MESEIRTLTYEEVKRELERAVNIKGRNHEAGASIISDDYGNPVCGVGQVFYQIDPVKFKAVRPQGLVSEPAVMMDFELEEKARELLLYFQASQDGSVDPKDKTWGTALDYALSMVEARWPVGKCLAD